MRSLHIGTSGLLAQQRVLDQAAHDLANATTPGHTRTRVGLLPGITTPANGLGAGEVGTGVVTGDVVRYRDDLLDQAARRSLSDAGSAEARSEWLGRAQDVLGRAPDDVGGTLSGFWASFDDLVVDPTGGAARDGVLSAGGRVAAGLNRAAERLDRLTDDVHASLDARAAEVTALSAQVARLNGLVAEATVRGDVPADLMDQRDVALDRLSELVGATDVLPDADGGVEVRVGGAVLVSGTRAKTLEVDHTGGGLPTLRTASGQAVRAEGSVAGDLAALGDLAGVRAGVDDLTVRVRDQVNAAHAAGFGLDGVGGRDFFTGTGARDLAVDPSLGRDQVAASASGARADGDHALLLAGLRGQAVAGRTATDQATDLGGRLGTAGRDAAWAARGAAAAADGAEQRRLAAHAVNLDEATVQVMQAQHAYAASAQVVRAADELLQTLLGMMR